MRIDGERPGGLQQRDARIDGERPGGLERCEN